MARVHCLWNNEKGGLHLGRWLAGLTVGEANVGHPTQLMLDGWEAGTTWNAVYEPCRRVSYTCL